MSATAYPGELPPAPEVLQNLRRGSGGILPARLLIDGEMYLLHGDGRVYAVRRHAKPVKGKPGYVHPTEQQVRVTNPHLIDLVQRTYSALRPAGYRPPA